MKHFLTVLAFASVASTGLASFAYAQEPPPSIDIPAGPIWNQQDAEKKCPQVCPPHWNGQWTTTVWGKMSVCGTKEGVDVPIGPIWNNDDAKKKCPSQLATMKWNGNWKTTEPNKMSVCGCTLPVPLPN